jgi:hypothetical protein
MDFVDLCEELETLIERKLSEEIVEQQLSKIVVEMESAVEWQVNATGDEISMGDQDDLPIDLCEELEALEERVMAQISASNKLSWKLMMKRRCSRAYCKGGASQ